MAVHDTPNVTDAGLGGGANAIDWTDPFNGPVLWERAGWRQAADGYWYHPQYGPNQPYRQPPAPTGGKLPPGGGGGAPGTVPQAAGKSGVAKAMPYIQTGARAAATALSHRGQGGNSAVSDEIRQLLELQVQRMQQQQPLRDAVVQQAFTRIPAMYRQGMSAPGSTPYASTGDPIQDMIQQQRSQQQSQQPLYDALQHLAQSRMNPQWR